jgi:hypothetical protein
MAMEDKINMEVFDNYLLIKVIGIRNNLNSLIAGSIRMIELSKKYNRKNILADHSGITYNLNLSDMFNLVRLYETKLPDFKNIRIAGIVKPKDFELGGFWEKLSIKRGFDNKVFCNINEAIQWLEIEKS